MNSITRTGNLFLPVLAAVLAAVSSAPIKALTVGAAETVRVYAWFNGQGVRTTLKLLP